MTDTANNDSGRLLLFDVQRFCVHDGPGIRATVFLKGCPLRCQWCQNPESLSPEPEIAFYADRCAGCMVCADTCPNDAIVRGDYRIDRSRCRACGSCAEACPNEALRIIGYIEKPAVLVEKLQADKPYFDATDGGITLSGGEPLMQAEPVAELLALCREQGIHTCIETCGAVPWKAFTAVLTNTDLFYFDIKAGSDALHRRITGSPSNRISANARRLVETGARVEFRMPIVPGFNDSDVSLRGVAKVFKDLGRKRIRLLQYHRGGESKIGRIQSGQPVLDIPHARSREALGRAQRTFEDLGIDAVIEGAGINGRDHDTQSAFPERVWRLREQVQSAEPAICTERALLVTDYFKSNGKQSKPVIVSKAEALAHVMRNRTSKIHDGELLVGCFSSHRVGGSILPELHGTAMMMDLFRFPDRTINPVTLDKKDRRELLTKVLPFWLTRNIGIKAFPLPEALGFIADQLQGKKYLINETGGISHWVPDYGKLLALGTEGIAAQADKLEKEKVDADKKAFYRGVKIACRALEELAAPYAELARETARREIGANRGKDLLLIAEACSRVPRLPARSLHEAFQSILFAQIALNQESLDNSVCPGRLDQVLYPYYEADLKAGRLNKQDARELVGCFTVKMSEIVPIFSRHVTRFHGGMFNGQVVVVGGQDLGGSDATNDLTWMFLDAMDSLRMRQPNYHARIHRKSPAEYVARLAGMLRDGSGAPSLMNDEVVVPMLQDRGMSREDALNYSPVGCIEPVACGVTFGSTDAALSNVALPLEWALGTKNGGAESRPAVECGSIADFVDQYEIQVNYLVRDLIHNLQAIERANADFHPTPLTSMLLGGCMEQGIDSTAGGAKYNASGVQAVGVADVADSFAAIDHVVFRKRFCSMRELVAALEDDFKGHESLLGYLHKAPKFGNDDPGADRFVDRVMEIFAGALSNYRNTRGGPYLAGFYSVTSHVAFGDRTGALPSGRRSGKALANGLSPSNGADRLGPTASLNSVAGLDLRSKARNGSNVNLKLDSIALSGDAGVDALAGLIRGYFAKGGMQVQMNVFDPQVLIEARDDPSSHPWLLVRVSGYSAYFNDLSPAMKQEIIDRSLHRC